MHYNVDDPNYQCQEAIESDNLYAAPTLRTRIQSSCQWIKLLQLLPKAGF